MKIYLFHNKRKERKAELPSKCTGGGRGLPTIERNLAMNPFLNPFLLLFICNQDFICRIFLIRCPRFWLVMTRQDGEQKLILKICPQGYLWLTPPWPPHFLLRAQRVFLCEESTGHVIQSRGPLVHPMALFMFIYTPGISRLWQLCSQN